MSGKSRRRGRRLSRSQRKKVGRVVAAPVTTPAAPTAQKPAPVSKVSKVAPAATSTPVATKAPAAKTVVAETANVAGELKRIGMVGGIMVALLVAAYFVLPLILA
jgi:beta-lactamase regulating signal transducer with metallopeptidase domain